MSQFRFCYVTFIYEVEYVLKSKGLYLCHLFFFVFSGLSKRTTSEGLRTAFAQFGEVADGI